MNNSVDVVVSAPGKVILHGEHAVVYGKWDETFRHSSKNSNWDKPVVAQNPPEIDKSNGNEYIVKSIEKTWRSNKRALACSLDLRTVIKLRETKDGTVTVRLPNIDTYVTWTTKQLQQSFQLPFDDPLKPCGASEDLLARLKLFAGFPEDTSDTKKLAIIAFLYLFCGITEKHGTIPSVHVDVESFNLPVSAGLGSSASYATALSAGLLLWQGHLTSARRIDATEMGVWTEPELELINQWAFQAEKVIHGKPSGIDNCVSTYGGALCLQNGKMTRLKKMPQLRVLLVNTKVPRSTKLLVAAAREKYDKYPNIVQPLFESIEAVTQKCEEVLMTMAENPTADHYRTLNDLVEINQNQLRILGVSHPSLEQVCQVGTRHGLSMKLTGAGGGGCAVAFITPENQHSIPDVEVEVKKLGYECWETAVGCHGVAQHFHDDLDKIVTH